MHVGAPVQASNGKHVAGTIAPPLDELEQMRSALELGLRDYVDKNGFSDVVVGVSGGIDSALTAALAAEALGPERVHCVSMPSRFSSEASPRKLARRVARREFFELPIDPAYDALAQTLASVFEGRDADLTEENLQARIRSVPLMALSNKFGGCSSRPATSRSSQSDTRRSTATWRAASRCSRTSTRRTSSGSRATSTSAPAAS